MASVFDQLADAFIQRKRTLAERERPKTKLLGSDYFMPKSAKEDINNQLSVFEQGGLPGVLKEGAQKMYENPVVNTAISLAPGAGDIQAGYEFGKSIEEDRPLWETAAWGMSAVPGIPTIAPALKTVFHGSPKVFDKFALEHIGTGSGGAIYGKGVNLADEAQYAEKYAKEGGNLYKVDLPDESIAKMLDWNKPLHQQTKAVKEFAWENRGILENLAKQEGHPGIFGLTGNDLYTALLRDKEPEQVSKMLQDKGISGVKYLTQKSIAKPSSKQLHNYVVFDENVPQILERKAQPIK